MKNKYVIFDLDDTLTYEIDFLKSAYREIAANLNSDSADKLYENMFLQYSKGENVFKNLTEQFPSFTLESLLKIYRNHFPKINLTSEGQELIEFCRREKYKLGLITDGRSITQRNKLKALDIENVFDKIVISEEFGSEKPTEQNFKAFEKENIATYFYIADNTKKDFIAPNKLGWETVCLVDKGHNIHKQDFSLPDKYLPKYKVVSLLDVKSILIDNLHDIGGS